MLLNISYTEYKSKDQEMITTFIFFFALLQVQEHCLIANETFELQTNTHHYQPPCRDLPLKYLALFH